MIDWAAEEIDRARHELILQGIRAEDLDDALAGALVLASHPAPRKRRIWLTILGLTLAAVCFAFVAWNLFYIAPAVW